MENWYTTGANAGVRCERLLASKEWQSSNTTTKDGLLKRFDLIADAGLSEMRVISLNTIENLGRIPRSNEGYTVKAKDVIMSRGQNISNKPLAVISFYLIDGRGLIGVII